MARRRRAKAELRRAKFADSRLAIAAAAFLLAAAAGADPPPETPRRADGPISGYWFATPETRAIQDDEFSNPGLLYVDRGAARWSAPAGAAGKSCADCHGAARDSMRGVGAAYPAVDAETGALINLGQRIRRCRAVHMGAKPLPPDSEALLDLEAHVMTRSAGLPMNPVIAGPAAPHFARGKALYHRRVGQMDLACAMCHDDRVGHYLRAEHISQGHIVGFPAYLMRWGALAGAHRRFQFCNEQARAEPLPLDHPDYNALQLYVAWRGAGLPIETPAVRR